MPELRVIFWKGWITSERMENPGWFDSWKKTAKEIEDSGKQLVVFKIPANNFGIADPDTVEKIERLLQELYPNEKS